MPLLHIFILGFSSAVVAVWLKHHFFSLPDNWLSISLPFLISIASLFLFTLWLLWRVRKRSGATLSLRPLYALPVIFIMGAVIFNTQAFLRGALLSDGPLIPFISWVSANFSFSTKLGSVIILFIVLTLALYAAGNFILRVGFHSRTDDNTLYQTLLRIAIGAVAWVSFLLAIGILGRLRAPVIWAAFAALTLSEGRALITLMRQTYHVTAWEISWRDPRPYLLMFSLFLIAFTLTQSLRPDPTGYDDMTQYMDRAHLMSERETLISGGHPYPFELLAAALGIASKDETMLFTLSLGTYSLIFGALILYGFGRSFFGPVAGLIATAIALSMPMGAALAVREVKPDSLLFGIALLCLWSLLRALKEHDLRFWYFAVTLFAFALSLKLTAALLIGPFLIGLTILILNRKKIPGLSWRPFLLTILFGLLPLFPWIGYGVSTRPLSLPTTLDGLLSSDPSSTATLRSTLSDFVQENHCTTTGADEDFARFETGRRGLSKYIFLPWDLTLNLQARAFATEIGLLFLALLPLGLIRSSIEPRKLFEKLLQPSVQIGLFALSYFFLWAILAEGVIWYSYPGLGLLAIFIAGYIQPVPASNRLPRGFFWIVLALGLIGGSLVQMKLTTERAQVLYASGMIESDEFLNHAIASYGTTFNILNQLPNGGILLTSSQLWYGIQDNDHRAAMDSYLDTFNCLYHERDASLTLERFREFGIRYVLFARGYNAELQSGSRTSFNEKISAFTDFVGKNMKVVWGSAHYTIFEVPRWQIELEW